jgi:hypothetical protein
VEKKMTTNRNKETKKSEDADVHIHYGGMTIGSLLRQLEADKSLDGVREEILAEITAAKSKRALESQQKNDDGNS